MHHHLFALFHQFIIDSHSTDNIAFDGIKLVDRPWFPYLCTEVEHWRWETHDQAHYNFWVALSGEGYLSCDGTMYPVQPGSFFVFSPQQQISAAHYSGPRITRFSAHFLPTLRGKILPSVDCFPLLGGKIDSLPLIQRQIDVVMRTAISRQDDANLANLLYQLIAQSCGRLDITGDSGSTVLNPIDPRVAEAIHIFREDPASVASMDAMARQLGISRSHFDRAFSSQAGQPPQQFLLNCKMIHARRLLESSSLRVGEIAEALGYNDIYFFSRQFKTFCGLSPMNTVSRLCRSSQIRESLQNPMLDMAFQTTRIAPHEK
ncbi:MAG: AraC family transcriptional regulator [Verrucomicrobiae bacterium]|nr:AraC family transcriptional regulator [Verrucomicrobiae bacterium]NNJ87014.1 helix-turn-helix transcriptional regulator [Akkermansiaceae bacterium]